MWDGHVIYSTQPQATYDGQIARGVMSINTHSLMCMAKIKLVGPMTPTSSNHYSRNVAC